jgi:hypothetical protein
MGLTSLAAVLVVSAGVALAVWRSEGDETDTPKPQPTPTVKAPEQQDRADALASVAATYPRISEAIQSVESADLPALFKTIQWKDATCAAPGERGIAPPCADLGLPPGSSIRLFQLELHAESYFDESTLHARFSKLLAGNHPTFALLAVRDDGSGRLSFTLDDQGTGIRALDFVINANSATPLVAFTERYVGSTPLDTIREQESRDGMAQSRLIYISPGLNAWEQEKDALRRNPSPGPGVTPAKP